MFFSIPCRGDPSGRPLRFASTASGCYNKVNQDNGQSMKVLLLQNIKNIGLKGEIKDVSDGYAVNFLLPKKMAVPAAATTVLGYREQEALLRREAEKELATAQKLAGSLDGQVVEIFAKSSKDGVLFGGITATQVAEALNKQGYKVTKEQVMIAKAIKTVGEHPVTVKLRHGLEAEIMVVVEEE